MGIQKYTIKINRCSDPDKLWYSKSIGNTFIVIEDTDPSQSFSFKLSKDVRAKKKNPRLILKSDCKILKVFPYKSNAKK